MSTHLRPGASELEMADGWNSHGRIGCDLCVGRCLGEDQSVRRGLSMPGTTPSGACAFLIEVGTV
jgi:hypothetical protein